MLAAPRDAAYRAMLGAAYMEEGRFVSAAAAFDDARTLGDDSAAHRAQPGAGACRTGASSRRPWRCWSEYQRDLDPVDLGLALALAGEADRGVTF